MLNHNIPMLTVLSEVWNALYTKVKIIEIFSCQKCYYTFAMIYIYEINHLYQMLKQ